MQIVKRAWYLESITFRFESHLHSNPNSAIYYIILGKFINLSDPQFLMGKTGIITPIQRASVRTRDIKYAKPGKSKTLNK